MSTYIGHRDYIDLPEWRMLSQPVFGSFSTPGLTTGTGWMAEDFRNNDYSNGLVYFVTNNQNQLNAYNCKNDAWGPISTSFGLNGGGQTVVTVFVPSFGPMGTIGTASGGNTTTKLALSTALPASVATNRLANRGDGKGVIIRIIGNAAGSSGKIEERHIVANTSGTTPTLILDEPLTFTPASGDRYEFLSGSVLAYVQSTNAANCFKRYDVATGYIVALTTTLTANLPGLTVGGILIATDEGYVPYNRKCYEGYYVGTATYDLSNTLTGGVKGCLQATSTAAGTLTGQASGGDAGVLANQWRNYQIRIVEDTGTPTAVGQRRRITSHTAGPSAVYTLSSNWTVTPSSTAKYVLENWTDNVLFFANNSSTDMYNYTHTQLAGGGTTDRWDITTWAAKPVTTTASPGSMAFHSFGIMPDELNSRKASNIYLWRGATTTYDILDVSGAATGSWTTVTAPINWGSVSAYDAFSAGDAHAFTYNPHTQEGKYFYFYLGTSNSTLNAQKSALRFDAVSGTIEKYQGMRMGSDVQNSQIQYRQAFTSVYHDSTNNTKVAFWNCPRPTGNKEWFQTPLIR